MKNPRIKRCHALTLLYSIDGPLDMYSSDLERLETEVFATLKYLFVNILFLQPISYSVVKKKYESKFVYD